jgi:hypothetical protein
MKYEIVHKKSGCFNYPYRILKQPLFYALHCTLYIEKLYLI